MLQVHINRAEGLPSCDRISNRWDDDEKQMANRRTEADPFIKLQILPEKRLKVRKKNAQTVRVIYTITLTFHPDPRLRFTRDKLYF